MNVRLSLAALSLAAALPAADLPMGQVIAIDGSAVVLEFGPAAQLTPGSMVALYGAGAVQRHPLTKEIIAERRTLVAKAQLTTHEQGRWQALLRWSATGAALTVGADAVPLPAEAAPNAAPLLATAANLRQTAGTSTLAQIAGSDADGDAVAYRWRLDGPVGRSGLLATDHTRLPQVQWLAAGLPGDASLVLIATDQWGQRSEARYPLSSVALDDPRKRTLKPLTSRGTGREHELACLTRLANGTWMGAGQADGKLWIISPAWELASSLPSSEVREPIALATRGDELLVLDANRRAVLVLGPDHALRATIGGFARPTGMTVLPDGTVVVADQESGGLLVHERSGAFRARLGRPGKEAGDFQRLIKVASAPAGTLLALDAQTRQVHRFDRWMTRLSSYDVPGEPANQPVDVAPHPRGVLVLLQDGQVIVFDAKGHPGEALPALAAGKLGVEPGRASTLHVEPDGDTLVLFGESGLIARYSPDGRLYGVRGANLRAGTSWKADGQGRVLAWDADQGLTLCDAAGWRTARLELPVSAGGMFSAASAIALAPDGTALVISDPKQKVIRRYELPGTGKFLVFGQPGSNPGQFESITSLAMDEAGRTWAVDAESHRLSVFNPDGTLLAAVTGTGRSTADLIEPTLVAAGPESIYVVDADRIEVKKFRLDAAARTLVHAGTTGGKGGAPGQFRNPVALGVDRAGLLYVLDGSRQDLQVIDYRGSSAVTILVKPMKDLGLDSIRGGAIAPDGQVWLAGDGRLNGFTW